MWILKLDQTGNISWQKTYGSQYGDGASSIQQTTDGGYIVVGVLGYYYLCILKLDTDGIVSWQKAYYGAYGAINCDIHQIKDDGYIVSGATRDFGAGGYDIWILKLDQTGNISWQKTYGGTNDEQSTSIQQTNDGGYIVAGETQSYGSGNKDMWVLKLDSNGNINNADFIGTSNTYVGNISVSGVTSNASISTPSFTMTDTAAIPQDSASQIVEQCFAADWFPMDQPPESQEKLNGVWGYLCRCNP